MTKSLKIIFSILIFQTLLSCEKKETSLEFEKNFMCEILPSLVDSIALDRRLFMIPPPLAKPIFNKTGDVVGFDSTGLEKIKIEYEKKIRELKKDTANLIFAIEDSAYKLEDENRISIKEHFKNIQTDSIDLQLKYKIDFKNCQSDYKLKYLSEFPQRDQIWSTKYSFEFGGIISFSKIQFDKKRKYGVLSGSYMCGGLCGHGFRFFIKKVNNKWIIDKIDNTWIS